MNGLDMTQTSGLMVFSREVLWGTRHPPVSSRSFPTGPGRASPGGATPNGPRRPDVAASNQAGEKPRNSGGRSSSASCLHFLRRNDTWIEKGRTRAYQMEREDLTNAGENFITPLTKPWTFGRRISPSLRVQGTLGEAE